MLKKFTRLLSISALIVGCLLLVESVQSSRKNHSASSKGTQQIIDTSNVSPRTLADYPDLDAMSALQECLKVSVTDGDPWEVTQAKCYRKLGELACIEKGIYANLQVLIMQGTHDYRCLDMQSKELASATNLYGTDDQKQLYALASTPSAARSNSEKKRNGSDAELSMHYYFDCLFRMVANDRLPTDATQTCAKEGITWCNAQGKNVPPDVRIDPDTETLTIPNIACAADLSDAYRVARQNYRIEFQNYLHSGDAYEPILLDIRKYPRLAN